MKVAHLYAGTDGESHFEEVEIPLSVTGPLRRASKDFQATGVSFKEYEKDYEIGWHPTSHREFVIMLEGAFEIEVGDGSKRQFGPGSIIMVEDTTGRGHMARTINHRSRKCIIVTLD